MRKLIVVALASATFGGMIAALATAAVQSQASPEAIAAAVQKVEDASAERSLRDIDSATGRISAATATISAATSPLHGDLQGIASTLQSTNVRIGLVGALPTLQGLLVKICENTLPAGGFTADCL